MFPPEPRPAAVVVLRRVDGAVFLVERPKTSRFFPGHHAFPGGGVEPHDGAPGTLEAFRACAVRELAEEVLVRVDGKELRPAGVTITPPFSNIRYHSQFFLVPLPPGEEPRPQQPELAGGRWLTPRDALASWERGEIKLPPPVLYVLEVLDSDGPEGLTARGTEESRFPIAFGKGLRVEPLAVRTLPPHTHTNAFVLGTDDLAVVDPGAGGPELAPLTAALAQITERRGRVRYVLLSHHHADHVGGVREMLSTFGAELACSAETGQRLGLRPDLPLADGTSLRLGDVHVDPVETPGHAPGHLAYHVREARAILPGDLVAGIGTILVAPPEGDMAQYMASLLKLADLAESSGARLLFPSHGPPSFAPVERLREVHGHRLMREGRVLGALSQGPADDEAIAVAAYADTPAAPAQLALLSTRAHLEKLEREGRARRSGGQWSSR